MNCVDFCYKTVCTNTLPVFVKMNGDTGLTGGINIQIIRYRDEEKIYPVIFIQFDIQC